MCWIPCAGPTDWPPSPVSTVSAQIWIRWQSWGLAPGPKRHFAEDVVPTALPLSFKQVRLLADNATFLILSGDN
ncbi:MAG: hypothetical protein OXU68_12975 [Bacteroidota bacterium]|nr:hypothetical protein [Bacteroidota bacterium]